MAVSITNVIANYDVDGDSSATTASVTPGSNKLQLLSVFSRTGISTEPNQPTVSGNGLTWVAIASIYFDTDSSSRKKLSLFRALGASPSTGTITIDFGGQNQTDVFWTLDEVSGMDTSGTNGSGAIVQSATTKDETSGGGLITVTLGAFSSAYNATFGTFASDEGAGGTPSVGSGFTLLATQHPSPLNETITEWKGANDTTVDATMPSASGEKMGGIAIEIAAAVAASTTHKRLALLGVS